MRILLALLCLGLLTGCRHKKPAAFPPSGATPAPKSSSAKGSKHPEVIVTPASILEGKVVRVNPGGRFAVLNFPIGHLPAIDQRLNVYRLGLKVGEVRVTGPQLDDNIVSDIVAGDAAPGDEVRDR